ncbi:MAG TPA: cytochrome d ubiquinol oxidase subunit II, partial [Paenalcaligenes sp.]|nr:cytochrome d ubiquinol oxidase subunit II [Paenalcaligenes sp.]
MIDFLAAALGVSASDPFFWLPLLFFALFVLVSFLGMLLDGFDIGVGCLIGVAPQELRARMLGLLSPWRDANELWLLMGLGVLATVFPGAWAGLLDHLFIPLFLLAMGVLVRTVCFEWRLRAPEAQQPVWAVGFCLGSLTVAFAHGLLVAQVVVNGQWQGGYLWFSLLVGLCSVAAYLLLGAAWLMMRQAGVLRVRSILWARRSIRWFAAGVV